MKQFRITMTCDEGFVADSLRDLAIAYENNENDEMEIETYRYCAKIEED